MIVLDAPAKINWFLTVLCRRDDGYHNISSLMQCVSIADSLTLEEADRVEVVTDAGIPEQENLVYRAALLMKEKAGIKSGVRIALRKEIPLAAGLGGGSSDAAAALAGLNRLWGLNLSPGELSAVGEELGSDVPFFFQGPAAQVGGRGEIVFPFPLQRSCTLLLVKPPVGVSAAWAYAQVDKPRCSQVLTKKDNTIKLFCRALEEGDFSFLSSLQKNDLEPLVAKRYPIIGEIKRKLLLKGAVFSSMSGSGPTVFGVFPSDEEAARAAEDFSPNWCRVVRTVTGYA